MSGSAPHSVALSTQCRPVPSVLLGYVVGGGRLKCLLQAGGPGAAFVGSLVTSCAHLASEGRAVSGSQKARTQPSGQAQKGAIPHGATRGHCPSHITAASEDGPPWAAWTLARFRDLPAGCQSHPANPALATLAFSWREDIS
ncbi:hypothetical protein H1C71_039879 [Ictidomys tridecemlineatus]|nr:hypothetical protein H1C71_039879 [Ictidomys tridecemlineatus]